MNAPGRGRQVAGYAGLLIAMMLQATPPARADAAPDTNRVAQAPAAPAVSEDVLYAVRNMDSSDLIRMRGGFGDFRGTAAAVRPEGLEGLRAEKRRDAAPQGLVPWDRIERVEKRDNNSARAALRGGIALGLLGGLLSYAIVSGMGDSDKAGTAMVQGGLFCGALGAVIGAATGAGSHHWTQVYPRP